MTRIFVTGGTGFIGSRFVPIAVEAGHEVHVLSRSEKSAEKIRANGATPVTGNLLAEGEWQKDAAQAEAVVHLAQPDTYGTRVTLKRAQNYRGQRLKIDEMLLNSLNPQTIRRVLYVGGTSYIGDQGKDLQDEATKPNPKGWGPYIAPAIERVPEFVKRGLPIVEVFPGWVYGPGSWFAEYDIEPIQAGKKVTGLSGPDRVCSPIHVDDVARALLHLLTAGETGQRYFIVDDQPVLVSRLPQLVAETLGVPLRTLKVPVWLATLLLGPIVTESLTCDFRLSNRRFKQTGFQFDYPTVETGIPKAINQWQGRKQLESVGK
jgi:nucleoside-diphosphate-sugar epimerase